MRQLMRIAALAALTFAFIAAQSTPASADHGYISGIVTDARNGSAIAGVCIKLGQNPAAPCWTYTNSDGRYLAALPAAPDGGYWQLSLSKKKYATLLTAPIYVDGPTTYNVSLSRR